MYLQYLSEHRLRSLPAFENLCYVTVLQTHWDVILGDLKVKRTQSKGISKLDAIFFSMCLH